MYRIVDGESVKRSSKAYKNSIDDVISEFNSNGKPTVVYTIDVFFPIVDGVVNVVDNYAAKLSDNFNVLVVAPSFKGRVPARSYPVLAVKSVYSKALAYEVPMIDARSKRLIKKLRIDLVHCHSPFFVGRYLLKVAKKRGVPFISTFHSQYKLDFEKIVGRGGLMRFLMRFIMKPFKQSGEVWTMNEKCVEILNGYGYEGKTRIVPHGTALLPAADYESERAAAREELNVGDKPLFIFVGRLVTQKQILFIAEVLGELKGMGLDFKMLFVGDGPDRGRLEKKLKEENVSDKVEFAGNVSDREKLCSVYAAADLLLFPSTYDTFALVKVEAASRNTPAAFGQGCAAASGVDNGVNGYIFPLERKKFAEGVYNAVTDKEGLERTGRNAFRDLYTDWDGIVKTVESYYSEIIKNSK